MNIPKAYLVTPKLSQTPKPYLLIDPSKILNFPEPLTLTSPIDPSKGTPQGKVEGNPKVLNYKVRSMGP